ncbi:TonB-dependent receptor [Sphingomonas naphthae]|uniref:TonB-dependent receptor n=1 Tax=Sphingomonas naphthae TaxID=1813468 RepID=A0ABY7TN80_9SPHN|nr:TonB-dependent receptor [Sphingomonas naphthae]WCT74488.1 TonB-dependent receptor [Sphingomonas naphthae]
MTNKAMMMLGATALATMVCAAPALAQSQPAAPAVPVASEQATDGDIVVTALRRDQRLQEAPAAVSVVTSETIQNAGVQSLNDVGKLVPSLRFEAGLRPGVPSIALRGIAAVQGGDAPFSLIVDGVQVPFLELVNQDLLDIASVELLKGPQGALYGRGAIAGALIINTQAPGDEFRGSLKLSAEGGGDYRGAATVSGPLIDGVLSAKVTGSYRKRDGMIYIRTLDRDGDYADDGTLRGQLHFTPGADTAIDLIGSYTKAKDGWALFAQIPVGVPGAIKDFDTYKPNQNVKPVTRRTLWNTALKINQKVGIGTITSVTQYAYALARNFNDFDYSPVPGRVNTNPIKDTAFNQDLRFSSTLDGAFNFIVGAFYQKRIGHNDVNIRPDPAAVPPLLPSQTTLQHLTSEAWAGYGQANLELGAWSLTAAVRYDEDKRFDELTNVPGSGVSNTFSAWQPSATVKYQFSPDFMAYGTVGRGFRSGGFNAQNLVIPAIGAQRIYPKEMSTSYEAGFKSQAFNRRLTFNVAAFLTNFENSQFQQTLVVPVPARFITSIPKVRVKGLEADIVLRPVADVTITGAVSITHARIRDFNGTALYVGNQPPNVYSDNEQLSIQYNPEVMDGYRALFRLDGNRRGKISYDLTEQFTFQPAAFLDARVGVEADRWTLAVYGKNLTSKRAPDFFSPLAFRVASARLENLSFRAGVELSVKFGAR